MREINKNMTKVLINFQDEFLKEIDKIVELEHRTRSSLIREALRRYLSQYKAETIQSETNIESKALKEQAIYETVV